jgi:hypothetical protein
LDWKVVAVYVLGAAILVYILWAMTQLGKVRYRSCKFCTSYNIPTDHEPCDTCELRVDLERPTAFIEDAGYLERQRRHSSRPP